MHSGNLLVLLALVLTCSSAVGFLLAACRRSSTGAVRLGRITYLGSVFAVVLASALFLRLILKNDFSIRYVALNSSRQLPLYYKISVFWAQQQGSFLFWALASGILGIWVMRKSREFEPWLMVVWTAMQALFMALLLIDSPFALLSSQDQLNYFHSAGVPIDGYGLRELLQNPWMAIHPPLVFIGYAAMCVPAAFAIAALIKGDFKSWCRATLPWAIFGWVTLGMGIILGAYWAYEVLGWGGYWGWDPVENASLVPWIIGTALVHGMLAERYRGSFRRINFVLALAVMLVVFDATFLTRSNILGTDLFGKAVEGSVHTFGDAAIGQPIVWFIRAFAVASVLLLSWRWKKIESERSYTVIKSKDFAFYLATITFVIAGALVLIGTSLPIIGKITGGHLRFVLNWAEGHQLASWVSFLTGRVKLDQAFYSPASAPVAFVVMALLALAPVLAWRRGKEGSPAEGTGIVIAAVVIGLPFLSLRFASHSVLIFAIGIALLSFIGLALNARAMVRIRRFRLMGGYLAHVGIAIMFLGVVLSANGGSSTRVSLPQGKAKTVRLSVTGLPARFADYSVIYKGNDQLSDRKFLAKVQIERAGKTIQATPMLQLTREGQFLQTPYIAKSFAKDIYVAPQSIPAIPSEGILDPGVVQKLDDNGSTLTLTGLDVPSAMNDNKVSVGALLNLKIDGKVRRVEPYLVMRKAAVPSSDAESVPGMPVKISLDRISVDEHAAYVTLTAGGHNATLKLVRGRKAKSGNYELFFKQWVFPNEDMQHSAQVGAEIQITSAGKTATVTPEYSVKNAPQIETESKPVPLPGMDSTIALTGVNPETGQAQVAVTSTTAELDISVKPFISLVWIGVITALFGGLIAVWRRMSEANMNN